jgi:hypothetical protein
VLELYEGIASGFPCTMTHSLDVSAPSVPM